jgi:CubicO group peptidase (beta-lactamase class C family)
MSFVSSLEVRAALAGLDVQIEAARQEQHVPGLSVVIVADQDVLFLKGYGLADLVNALPATPHTIYRIGSNTKLFTATMLMQLRDAGKLQLDDPVERYLPAFSIPSRFPDSPPITFRQLATHTSGLPLEAPLEYGYHFTRTFPSIEALLSSLTYLERCQPPYTAYRYSNLGFNILGHTLAQIAQQPYAEYVTQHLLNPLGMNDSGFTHRRCAAACGRA